MNIAELFIRRPVMTTLIMGAILLFGIVAYRQLPVSDLPNVDFPTIQVNASLPGASPETMASAVAMPLEKQFSTIPGLDSMTSASGLGVTQITLQFNLSRNLDAAAQDVQAAIAVAARQLPPMPFPPSYQKVNPADQPILYIALTSPTLPLNQLDEYGETMMAQRISTVSGVAQVLVYGSQKYAVRAQVDPSALASRNIGLDDVMRAIQGGNVNLPTGTLYGPYKAYTVNAGTAPTGGRGDGGQCGVLDGGGGARLAAGRPHAGSQRGHFRRPRWRNSYERELDGERARHKRCDPARPFSPISRHRRPSHARGWRAYAPAESRPHARRWR